MIRQRQKLQILQVNVESWNRSKFGMVIREEEKERIEEEEIKKRIKIVECPIIMRNNKKVDKIRVTDVTRREENVF